MKPLDREPSDGAEPQRVLGDCATLGTIDLPNFRPALHTPVETRLRATLAAVTRFSEWPSHLTNTVGARKGGAARLLLGMQQSSTHRGAHGWQVAVHLPTIRLGQKA